MPAAVGVLCCEGMEGISRSELARRMGVSQPSVVERVRRGKCTLFADGSIDPASEAVWRAERGVGPLRVAPAPATTPETETRLAAPATYTEARTAETVAKARLKQLEYDLARGLLVQASDVSDRWSALGAALRSRLMAIPGRLAGELVGVADAHTIPLAIDREIRAALQDAAADAAPAAVEAA